MKPAEEVARELAEQVLNVLSVWGDRSSETKREKLTPIITSAIEAEREETLNDARVYMEHSPACAIAIALKQPYRGAIPECTCGLDKLLFSPAA
jgi:hypothetical protein